MKVRLYVIIVLLLATACKEKKTGQTTSSIFSTDKFDKTEFTERLKSIYRTRTDSAAQTTFPINNRLHDLYSKNGYAPLWLKSDGNNTAVESLFNDLQAVKLDGIDAERYQLSSLKSRFSEYKTKDEIDINYIIALDTTLTYCYLKASKELLIGLVSPRSVDSLWFHVNDSLWNTDYILSSISENKYPSLDSFRSNIETYSLLKKSLQHYTSLSSNDSLRRLKSSAKMSTPADSIIESIIHIETPWLSPISDSLTGTAARIQAYQQYFGIRRTGKVDSTTLSCLSLDPKDAISLITINMERLRWLPRNFETEYIIVNIPTMNFSMKRNENEVMKMNVVVGKPSRQTPALDASMSNIVINPPWGVPPTILKNDVLPGVLRSGSGYLRKKGLEAFDHKGNRIDASTITASNYKRYTFRQPPGYSNALGYVKFNFPNKWDIYMHDTPHREDFEKFDRARSSGCVRLQHPQDLAKYILTDIEGKNYDQVKLDSMIAARKTKSEVLKRKIPVHIIYLTAWDDDSGNNIRFARDFYKRDAKLIAAISK